MWRTLTVSISKRRERASRNGSTVVDIYIPPPSFKPVSLSWSRSPLSKTPKQVFFLTLSTFCHLLPHYNTIINFYFFFI